jgi:hypothetical protein
MALTGLDEQAARKFCPACVSVVTKPLDYYAVDEILRRHVRMYRLSGMMTRSGQVEQS